MKGILRIHNPNAMLGTIRFADGSESGVLRLPDCLEDGDRVDARFQGDDPKGRLLRLTAMSSNWRYGFIITSSRDSERYWSRILVTHPRPIGLLSYREERLPKGEAGAFQQKLKFRIRKEWIGGECKQEAVSLRTDLSPEERAFCIQPMYGKLEARPCRNLTGVVKEILDNPVEPRSGWIKFVGGRDERDGSPLYGFIESDDMGENLYFPVHRFVKVFDRLPEVGETVHFLPKRTKRGWQVHRFVPRETFHDPHKPVGVLLLEGGPEKEIHFPAEAFFRLHGRRPQRGDLVAVSLDRWGYPHLMKEEDAHGRPLELRLLGRKESNGGVLSGYVSKYLNENGYGFVRPWSGGGREHYFHVRVFRSAYPDLRPVFGQEVRFEARTDSETGKTWVSRFHPVSADNRQAEYPPEAATALLQPEPGAVYRVRQDERGRIIEYHKADLSLRAEAIACYKDRDLLLDEKLEAIETLIRLGYESKNVKQETLKEQRRRILERRVKSAIEYGNAEAALRWESRLQAIHYQPSRLASLRSLYPVPELPDHSADDEIHPLEGQCSRALLLGMVGPVRRMPAETAWSLFSTEIDYPTIPCGEEPWALTIDSLPDPQMPLDFIAGRYALDV